MYLYIIILISLPHFPAGDAEHVDDDPLGQVKGSAEVRSLPQGDRHDAWCQSG